MSERSVIIRGLEVTTRIGVPEAERAAAQRLLVDLEMTPAAAFSSMGDAIDATIDYHAVSLAVTELAARGERRLVETLADEIATLVLGRHGAVAVEVTIRKFILPQTEWVGVRLRRRRET
jgi:dihydroneopterin aldolase